MMPGSGMGGMPGGDMGGAPGGGMPDGGRIRIITAQAK